jgi:YidC/Oxa1 family membrane protein insertase
MNTGRFLLAVILAMAVVLLTNLLFPPPKPAVPPATGADTTVVQAAPGTTAVRATPDTAPPTAVPGAQGTTQVPGAQRVAGTGESAPADTLSADTVHIASDLVRLGITTRGAGVASVVLSKFKSYTHPGAVELVGAQEPPLVRYRLRLGDQVLDLGTLLFTASADSVNVSGEPQNVTLRYQEPSGAYGIEIRYHFDPDRYVVRVDGQVTGLSALSPTLLLDLGPTLAINEADSAEDERALGYVVDSRKAGISSVPLAKVDAERVEEGPLSWVALKNKYFLAAALAEAPGGGDGAFGGLIARPLPAKNAAALAATLPVNRDGQFAFQLFLGPQDYGRLAAVGRDLQDVNPYGWHFLRPIIRPLAHFIIWLLTTLHGVLSIGYGWVLILFGMLVQIILWPLNVRAMRSQMKTMELQPRIKEIQDKYKQDPEKLQKEMMRLYREEGFNPLGGCLPMLIPWPVLITLFFVFQNTIEFRGVSFLWLPDLSRPDPLFILPVVLGASIFVMQWMSMRTAPQQGGQMKFMMYFMPVMMVVIFFRLAAGLNLYYAASNLASIPRQVMLVRERMRVRSRMDKK